MCSAISHMAEKLQLCFSEVPLSMDVVDQILQDASNRKPLEDLKKQMITLRKHKVVKPLQILLPVRHRH